MDITMPQQIKGKSPSLLPKIIALDIEIIKIVKSDQPSIDQPEKQHFQVVIAKPPEIQTKLTSVETPQSTTQK